MDVPFAGGCACGAVRYECSAEPIMALNCHCRDCQRASGTAYASAVLLPDNALRMTKGEPKYYTVTADSGNVISRGFCATCGSPVLAKQTAFPIVSVFAASAQPWDYMNPALLKFSRGAGS